MSTGDSFLLDSMNSHAHAAGIMLSIGVGMQPSISNRVDSTAPESQIHPGPLEADIEPAAEVRRSRMRPMPDRARQNTKTAVPGSPRFIWGLWGAGFEGRAVALLGTRLRRQRETGKTTASLLWSVSEGGRG